MGNEKGEEGGNCLPIKKIKKKKLAIVGLIEQVGLVMMVAACRTETQKGREGKGMAGRR